MRRRSRPFLRRQATGSTQDLRVLTPAAFEPSKRYPLVIDLDGKLAEPADAFYVTPLGAPYHTERASGEDIADYMAEKYPVDRAQVSVTPAKKKRSKRHWLRWPCRRSFCRGSRRFRWTNGWTIR